MTIPLEILLLVVSTVVGFVFKVVFGLITRNEEKSDEADRRTHEEIEKSRNNERELYKENSDIRERLARLEAKQC